MLYTSYLKTMSRLPTCMSQPATKREEPGASADSEQAARAASIRDPRGGLASPPCHHALASPRAPWSFGIVGLER